MSGYQQITNYKGSLYGAPKYVGMEYDFEVPDNMVVSSPGGVSAIHHHPTKGMYSDASSRWDIFGGEGRRYPYAEHGGIYQVGQNAPHYMGDFYPPPDAMYTQNQSTPHKENFTATPSVPVSDHSPSSTADSIEVIPSADGNTSVSLAGLTPAMQKIVPKNIIALVLIVLLGYLALDFWCLGAQGLLYRVFHDGKTPDWRWMIVYAVAFAGLAFLVAAATREPLLVLEGA